MQRQSQTVSLVDRFKYSVGKSDRKLPACIEERRNRKEPFTEEEFPDRPWQKIGLDLFKYFKWYLIATDYYSRYFEICAQSP